MSLTKRIFLYTVWISLSFFAVYYQVSENSKFKEEGIMTTGLIIDLDREVDDGESYYYPVIEFKDILGNKVEFRSSVSGSDYKIGDSLEITYMKNNPDQARIVSFSSSYLWLLLGSFWGALGILAIFIDVYSFYREKRQSLKKSKIQAIMDNQIDEKGFSENTEKPGSDEIEEKPIPSDPE